MTPRITEHDTTVEQGDAFYNPHTTFDRDLTIASLAAFTGTVDTLESYLDTFAATGIRGLRAASELGLAVTINDRSPDAACLIRQNIVLNGMQSRCEVTNEDANVLLHQRRFDVVDIDPFGSPAPFLAAASRSAKKMLCITATDTAPLCGAHLNAGIRKYACVPVNNEYHAETGVRVLMGAIARALAVGDRAMVPLLAYARRHYVRVYARVLKSATSADKSMKQLGFIVHCNNCGFREPVAGIVPRVLDRCRICGHRMKASGPMWLGRLYDLAFCESVYSELIDRESDKQAIKLVGTCKNEINIPTFYEHHLICRAVGVSPMKIDGFIDLLRDAGFEASRTHFSGTAFKTDADISSIAGILAGSAGMTWAGNRAEK
ncbi:MAG: tRNA (guanine(10)-N(2))-dimethyltransferase [Methanosarcinales archaeon]|jgi:tRNA (guanine26-N2/guanine27-N2)-dimethyltransferase|nr:tRNA (guanine(10)-N(2))-dimethyltransferase [Methanosarcinales archaeon]